MQNLVRSRWPFDPRVGQSVRHFLDVDQERNLQTPADAAAACGQVKGLASGGVRLDPIPERSSDAEPVNLPIDRGPASTSFAEAGADSSPSLESATSSRQGAIVAWTGARRPAPQAAQAVQITAVTGEKAIAEDFGGAETERPVALRCPLRRRERHLAGARRR
jgi:hypothetical protein